MILGLGDTKARCRPMILGHYDERPAALGGAGRFVFLFVGSGFSRI
jgi:hypothetical protein